MLNALLAYNPLAWIRISDIGSGDLVIGFFWLPLPVVLLGCAALWLFAAGPRANGPVACDRYGRVVYRRRHRLWVYPVAICLVVLAARGLKDHGHGTITIDPADRPPVVVLHRRAHQPDAGFEERMDRLGDHLDRTVEHRATQIEGQLDRGSAQIDEQLERTAAQVEQQLERVAAQIERQLDHVGRQISHKHHEAPRPVMAVAQAGAIDDPVVIEPNPPALPVLGLAQVDVPGPASSPIPGSAAPPAKSASTAPAAPLAAAATPAAAPTPPGAVKADAQSDKLPEWTKTEIVDEGNRKLVVVPGGFAGSQKEAEHDALEAARLVVGDAIQRVYPKVGKWLPTAEAVREDAVRRTYIEQIHRKTVSSGTPFVVYRAYLQVELSPNVCTQLVSSWKEAVLPHRLEALGGLAALLTLTFATGAAYFRLDDRTQGRYRRRLAVGAVAIIGAGAAAAAALI
jgi:hypothetical protein